MKEISNDIFQFDCTGNKIYAHRGIIGLTKIDEGEFSISQGYDGGIDYEDDPEDVNEDDYPWQLRKNEKLELADYMINLWQEYKNSIK